MKPNALINVKTGDILSWGYCDFSKMETEGIKQIEVESKPPDELRFCHYNPSTKQIEKKMDNEITDIQNAEKEIADKEKLIAQEMRNLAIASLKKQGKI